MMDAVRNLTPEEAQDTHGLIQRNVINTRDLLLEMRDRNGWKALGYESFVEYGRKALNFQESYLNKLVRVAEISRLERVLGEGAQWPSR